jgi:hypothetical protein
MIMMLVSKLLSAFHYISEEKLFDNYALDPLKVAGIEGMFGCIIFEILLPIFQHWTVTTSELFPFGLVEDSKLVF